MPKPVTSWQPMKAKFRASSREKPMPRNERVDPCYEELCREFDYGRYTEIARQARENPAMMDDYKPRQYWG